MTQALPTTKKKLKCVVNDENCPVLNGNPKVKSFAKNHTTIYICPNCKTINADLSFVQDQYETDEYYTMKYDSLNNIDLEWGFRWRYILNQIKRYSNHGDRILDVGAGNGYFVYLANMEFGFNACGAEISQKEIEFAKSHLNIELKKDYHDFKVGFDVLTSFNVLEHVNHPTMFLSDMLTVLKPGGLIVLSTPNPKCLKARIKGVKEWNIVCPPHHINIFSRRSLYKMLAKNNVEVKKYETLSTYIKMVDNIDTKGQILRKSMFSLMKTFNLGGDHFIIGVKN